MLDDVHSISLLTLMEIVGPIVLAVGLLYGIVRTRRSRAARLATERATRDVYQAEEARRRQARTG
jgi:hypothetical protein